MFDFLFLTSHQACKLLAEFFLSFLRFASRQFSCQYCSNPLVYHLLLSGESTRSGCGSLGSGAANWTGTARICTFAPKTTPRKKSPGKGGTPRAAAARTCGGGLRPWRVALRRRAGTRFLRLRGLGTLAKTSGTTTTTAATTAVAAAASLGN